MPCCLTNNLGPGDAISFWADWNKKSIRGWEYFFSSQFISCTLKQNKGLYSWNVFFIIISAGSYQRSKRDGCNWWECFLMKQIQLYSSRRHYLLQWLIQLELLCINVNLFPSNLHYATLNLNTWIGHLSNILMFLDLPSRSSEISFYENSADFSALAAA